MELPTRILKKPEIRFSEKSRQNELFIMTDKGEFTRHELCAILGMSGSGLYGRIKGNKWQRPNALLRGRLPTYKEDFGNEEWRSLSDKPRGRGVLYACGSQAAGRD